MWNESVFSALQLKRDPLGGMRHLLLTRTKMRSCWTVWLAVASACSDARPEKQASLPPLGSPPTIMDTAAFTNESTAAPIDTALGRCGVALQAPSADQQEVIDALKTAYGLEGVLFQRAGSDTISREQVYAHYRQGFSVELAQQLADYSWQPDSHMLRATDRALTVPDSVGVLELKQDRALVAWIPPTTFRKQWGAPRCLVDRLVREDARWIVEAREP